MKSGTSLLRKLLSRHPVFFGGLETHWFSKDFSDSFRDGRSRRQQWLLEFFDVPASEISHLRTDAADSDAFFSQFMAYCARREGKQRWIEKTPDNISHAQRIYARWPDATLICLRRDPRDIYASWKKNRKLDLETFLAQFQNVVATIDQCQHSHADQFCVVSYEQLVLQPESAMRELCAKLGVPYNDALHEYQGDASDLDKLTAVTGKHSATAESLAKPIFTDSLGQWQVVLDAAEAERITKVARATPEGAQWLRDTEARGK